MSPNIDRARRTVAAAEVLHFHLEIIASACRDALSDEVVVAEVRPDALFGGAHRIRRASLHQFVTTLPEGSWSAVFGPKEPIEAIEDRCIRMGYRAYRRAKLSAHRRRRLGAE
ncbi:MAG TPA: hypothetical protein VFB34_11725 [Chloroflexota bacterium]|nr:hypothetical protein [Chloroflexota bacterium]